MISSPPSARPFYLDAAPDPVFATFHAPPDEARADTAVLICPPWGWDEIASYRSRRTWAEQLAMRGHATLRIDFPGSGDSAGLPSDPDRLEAWSRAIGAAVAWLASAPGVSRVAAIGLGLGGLVAAKAIEGGAPIDDLVLWAAPANGRAFVREQRAFAALQSSSLHQAPDPAFTFLPDGWLEVGGFVLSADTIAAILRLELAAMPLGRLRRALLLERDGFGRDRTLESHLASLGVDVTATPGHGWTDMVFHPEQYQPPVAVIERVTDWLAGAPPGQSHPSDTKPPSIHDGLELRQAGVAIRESPIRIDRPFGQLFGLLAEPTETTRSTACAVFLNAGAVRRIGPNRLWVEASRRWSARGVPTVRMDLQGIGDADGDPLRYLDVGNFYTPDFGADVGSIVDELAGRGFGPRFVLIGLCAGGYWAFHTAAVDRRVVTALIINPRAIVWDPDLLTRREAHKIERLLAPALWRQVIRGEVPASRMLVVSRSLASTVVNAAIHAPDRLRARRPRERREDPIEALLDTLRDLGTRVVMAFSGDEPVYDELNADGILDRLDRWPNLVLEGLPEGDHTLRPIAAQRALLDMLDRELDRLLAE